MRQRHLLAACVAAIGLAASASTTAAAATSPRVFNLLESGPEISQPLGNLKFDRPPVGGDQFAFVHSLYEWKGSAKGARVGRLQVMITFITGFGTASGRNATVLITAQPSLAGGTLFVQGYGQATPGGLDRFTLPIVGGTGTYANARGYVVVRNLGRNGNSNVEFHILP